MVVELVWCFAAEGGEFFVEKGLNAGQGEVSEPTAVVEQVGDALWIVSV
jgi:hypothetical protein